MQKIIAIVGPTASGKTSLGISLARKIGGEIISADSRQIYRGMDIIAGTPTALEMHGVPHHLLRATDPRRHYSAGRFAREGARLATAIARRGNIPIVVGGTGFYADALLSGIELPEVPPNMKLRGELAKKTAAQLFTYLKRLDPRRAAEIDNDNPVRLIRAMEIARALGAVPPLPAAARSKKFEVLWLGLSPTPEAHRRAIRKRVREHLRRGLLAEAQRLRARLSKKRYDELGAEFRFIADCLDKKITKKELAIKLEQWELAYAKRQMRWLRRNAHIVWIQTKREAFAKAGKFTA